METLLNNVLQQIGFPIPVIKKYVDDLFLIIPREKTMEILDRFNGYNSNLQFTMEIQKDGKLPYLDTQVIRNPNHTLSTEWYSKSISSGRLLNYKSFHPLNMKLNVANNFIKRVKTLTTTTDFQHQKHVIFSNLLINDFPAGLIGRLINRVYQAPLEDPEHNTTQENMLSNLQYRSLPFVDQLSQQLAKQFKKHYPNLQIAHRIVNSNSGVLSKVKDPVDKMLTYNTIYSIPCLDCSKRYVGMSTQHLKKRLNGHRATIKKLIDLKSTGHTIENSEMQNLCKNTALVEHCALFDHNFDLENVDIIDRTYRPLGLPILEMCHIHTQSNLVNHRSDVDGLSTAYAGILHEGKKYVNKNLPKPSNTNTTTNPSIPPTPSNIASTARHPPNQLPANPITEEPIANRTRSKQNRK